MTRSLWRRVESLKVGQRLDGRAAWMTGERHLDTVCVRLGRVLSSSAHQLDEIVAYSSEISYLTRENVTGKINNVTYVDPP